MAMLDALWELMQKIPARVWLMIVLGVFLFCLGISVGHGCASPGKTPLPKETTVTRYETLPPPPPVVDTFYKPVLKWLHDTAWVAVAGKAEKIPAVSTCDSFDTTTPLGTHCSFCQCFLLPDSVIRQAAEPPIFTIREPAPVVKEVTNTVIETRYKPRPVDWTVELLKDGIIAAGGVLMGSRL
jgi:hypothetical protein